MKVPAALRDHYNALLELTKPWSIIGVIPNHKEKRVDIYIEWPEGRRVPCPECGKKCSIKDHTDERIWRHLDVMKSQSFLHCRIPRSNCPIHEVLTVKVPWAGPHSHWTTDFERHAITVLESTATTSKAASLLGLEWHKIHTIKSRAVDRGLQRRNLDGIEHIGIDEKSFVDKERFVTVLSDIDNNRVIEVAKTRTNEAAKATLAALTDEQLQGITAAAMDMSAGYESVCREKCPNAEIVNDKFHVVLNLNEGVDKVRRSEHALLLSKGIKIFTHSKYLWLTRSERWSEKQEKQFSIIEDHFGAGKFSQTKISRAWTLKETFDMFWDYAYAGAAKNFFDRWYFWATHSRLKPMIKVAKTLKRHLNNLLAYFRHGITNAFAEGINSKIQSIKADAKGFRNFENYRIAILFACGKLDLQP